jgi:glutamyl-Q tRNA(Asp) synthetase
MTPYRGRFAPSPTGPLHFGSLVTAVGSYLEARTHGGEWLLRMEDLDRAREQAGAADAIIASLQAHGFAWDGTLVYQSRRDALYRAALDQLRAAGQVYDCACSRREIGDSPGGLSGIASLSGTPIYPGTCRMGLAPGKTARAVRVRVGDAAIAFDDAIQGPVRQDLARDIGDFVLHRADGFFAYQLAVVVDDAEQGVTDIVRGADLLDSTPRQIFLQRLLRLPTPRYAHLPLALNAAGEKLSKQTRATVLDDGMAAANLVAALAFLGQDAPQALGKAGVAAVWDWALAHWQLARVPRHNKLAAGL